MDVLKALGGIAVGAAGANLSALKVFPIAYATSGNPLALAGTGVADGLLAYYGITEGLKQTDEFYQTTALTFGVFEGLYAAYEFLAALALLPPPQVG